MKKVFFAVVFSALALMGTAQASVLNLEAGSSNIEGVNISKGGKAAVADRSTALVTVGAGLRAKKVAIVNVKVYVAQLLLSDATRFVRNEGDALNSLDNVQTVALQMSFLRTVEADKVMTSFKDGLVENSVDLNNPAIKQFLDTVAQGGDAENGKSITIVLEKLPGGKEAVTYENTNGVSTTISGDAGFSKAVLSIWLGKSADSGLEKLKKAILGL